MRKGLDVVALGESGVGKTAFCLQVQLAVYSLMLVLIQGIVCHRAFRYGS